MTSECKNDYCSRLEKQAEDTFEEMQDILAQRRLVLVSLEEKYLKQVREIIGSELYTEHVEKYIQGEKWFNLIEDDALSRELTQHEGFFELDRVRINIEYGSRILPKARKVDSLIIELKKITSPHSHFFRRGNAQQLQAYLQNLP